METEIDCFPFKKYLFGQSVKLVLNADLSSFIYLFIYFIIIIES